MQYIAKTKGFNAMMNKSVKQMLAFSPCKRMFLAFLAFGFIFSGAAQQTNGVKIVVIDPGHGGSDPGAVGPNKKYEKDVVLAVSLRFGEMIKAAFPDVKVIYTRETDKFVGLAERAEMANKVKADLFISVHANASDNRSAYGSESWVLGMHKEASWLEVAKRENAVIAMEKDFETKYEAFDPNDPESYIWLTMRQHAFLEQSIKLAAAVQQQFGKTIKRFDRGVKQAGFLVLHRTTMPSILVEVGFISNYEEEKWMTTVEGETQMATSLFKAFESYKLSVEGVNNVVSGDGAKGQPTNDPKKEQPTNVVDKDPKKSTDAKEQGVVFSVQVFATPKATPINSKEFKGHTDVIEYISGGLHRYSIGKCKTHADAVKLQQQLKSEGFDSCFVVAFLNGDRIDVNKAKELAKK